MWLMSSFGGGDVSAPAIQATGGERQADLATAHSLNLSCQLVAAIDSDI